MLPSDLSFGAWVWQLASVTDMVVFHLEPEFKSQPLSSEQLRVDTSQDFPFQEQWVLWSPVAVAAMSTHNWGMPFCNQLVAQFSPGHAGDLEREQREE